MTKNVACVPGLRQLNVKASVPANPWKDPHREWAIIVYNTKQIWIFQSDNYQLVI